MSASHTRVNPAGYLKASVDLALDLEDYEPELRRWLHARLGISENPDCQDDSVAVATG